MTIQITEVLNVQGISAPATAPTGQGRIYFDSVSNTFKFSESGGAYTTFGSGGAGSFTNIGSSLLPAIDDGYSVGSSSLKWHDGYFGHQILISPNVDGYAIALLLRNVNTTNDALASIGSEYQLATTSGFVRAAARVAAGKEQAWTSTVTTQDGYLSFLTATDGVLLEGGRFNSAQQLAMTDGYATHPAFSFINAATTGIYRGTVTNRLAFAVEGINAGYITVAPTTSANSQGNVAFGYTAGNALDMSGSGIGGGALNNSFIGGESGYNTTTGQQNTFIGSRSGHDNVTGNQNTYIGQGAGFSGLTSANVMLGWHAGLNATGSNNMFLGSQAGEGASNTTATGSNNTFVGIQTAQAYTTGGNNTLVGYQAGAGISVGGDNVVVGYLAGIALGSGGENVIIGRESGKALSGQSFNVIIGSNAGNTTNSQNNTMVGYAAGILTSTGSGGNTLVGYEAGFAGTPLTTGAHNTLIGENAQVTSGTLANAMALGANAVVNGSNTIQLGDPNIVKVNTSGTVDITNNLDGYAIQLILRNPNTTSDNLAFSVLDFRLATTAGAEQAAAQIRSGKEQTWTSTLTTQDGYLSLYTALDSILTERVRLASAGMFSTTHLPLANDGYNIGNTTNVWHDGYYTLLSMSETSAPPNLSGFGNLYVKSADHHLYFKTSTGTETQVDTGGGVSGSGATNRIATWSGVSSLTSDANFTWDGTVQIIGGGTPGSNEKLWVQTAASGYSATVKNTSSANGPIFKVENDTGQIAFFEVLGSAHSSTDFGLSTTGNSAIISSNNGSAGLSIGTFSSGNLIFHTADVYRAQLDNSGYFQFGSTNTLGARFSITHNVAGEYTTSFKNTSSTSNSAIRIESDSNHDLVLSSGSSAAASSLFGTAIAGNQFMYTGDGILSIGTTAANNLVLGTNNTNRLQIHATTGEVAIPAGNKIDFGGGSSGINWYDNAGIIQSDATTLRIGQGTIQIGGIVSDWGSSGIRMFSQSYRSWLLQNQAYASDVLDARLISQAATSGQIATRVGTAITDAAGAKNAILFAAVTDATSTTPTVRLLIDGYGNTRRDGYSHYNVLTSPNLTPPVGVYSSATNTLNFSTASTSQMSLNSSGTLTMTQSAGNAIVIPTGGVLDLSGGGGTVSAQSFGGNFYIGNAAFRTQTQYLIGGINSSWSTSGLVFSGGGATAYVTNTQTGSVNDVRLVGNAKNAGEVASRVGTSSTIAQGAQNSTLFQACIDNSNISSPVPKYSIDGYGNSIQDGYSHFNVIIGLDKLPPVGIYSPSTNALAFTTGSTQHAQITSDGYFGINTTSPAHWLHVVGDGYFAAGAFSLPIVSTNTSSFTLDRTHYTLLADATNANITVNLPPASLVTGRLYNVKKTDSTANTVTVDGNAAETIDGAATQVLTTQWQSLTIQSSGVNWFII